MKKAITLISAVILMATLALQAQALEMSVPMYTLAPKVDGIIEAGEWQNSGTYEINHEKFINEGGTDSLQWGFESSEPKDYASGEYKYFWGEDGFYFAANILDSTIAEYPIKGEQLNAGDVVQLVFDPLNKKTKGTTDAYIFDFSPASGKDATGEPLWFEHWQYAGVKDSAGVVVAGERNEQNWTVEAFIPWSAFTVKGEQFTVKEGYKIGFGQLLMDTKGNALKILFADFGNGKNTIDNASTYNTMTFGSKVENLAATGIRPEVATPTPEATPEVTATPVAEATPAQTSTPTPETPDVLTDSNNTTALVITIIIVVALASAIVIFIKRKKK